MNRANTAAARALSQHELAQAARPTLFDAAARPELLVVLIYANLMSPLLWDLLAKITARAGAAAGADTPALMAQIHADVDGRFYHMDPLGFAGSEGLLDLDEERGRLSAASVDEALRIIRRGLEGLADAGRLKPGQDIFALIDAGRFPEYEYATLEVIEAHAQTLGWKHRPLGVTMCADEAVLIASLALAAGRVIPAEVAILGSPVHYSVFLHPEGNGHWFNGKHEYHDAQGWRNLVQGMSAAQIQQLVDDRCFYLDRISTPRGVLWMGHGLSTLAPEAVDALDAELRRFLGIELREIGDVRQGLHFERSPLLDAPALDLRGCECAEDVVAKVVALAESFPGSVYELALYTARRLEVATPGAYVRAARRGWRLQRAARQVRTLEDALDCLAGVPGHDPVFGSVDRIALPDEVLLFARGSHRDRALLLYCLCLESAHLPQAVKDDTEVLFCAGASLLRMGQRCIDVMTLRPVDACPPPWISLSESGGDPSRARPGAG